jgi:surfeit locus 1 family protein
MAEIRARFPWGLTLASAIAFVLLCGLGTWQVQRLQWKEGLIAEAEAAAKAPPQPLSTVLAAANPEFRKAVVACPGLATAPFAELQTIQEGQAGVRLVSACRPEGAGVTFLVDRGFVADTVSARPPVTASGTPVQITVELRQAPPPGPMALPANGLHFYARDTAPMARALGVTGPVEPRTLYALTSSNPDWLALQPSAPPAAFSNNHLGYALTWFGLALALLGFYIALLRRKLRAPTPSGDTEKSTT